MLVQKSSMCQTQPHSLQTSAQDIYYTKAHLAKMYPNIAPACDKLQQSSGVLIHTFWICSRLLNYWSKVFEIMSAVIGKMLLPKPLSPLFGVALSHLQFSTQKTAVAFMTFIARWLTLLKWKCPAPPSCVHRLRDLLNFLSLKKISFIVKYFFDTCL